MTTRQVDAWDFFIKKVCPALSIVGTLLYICFYVGSHFGVIEKNQDETKVDIKDLKTNFGTLKDDFNSFKSKYNTDRVTDSLKRQILSSAQQNRQSSALWYTEHVDKPGGKVTRIPTTN